MPWNDFLQPLESIIYCWLIKGWNVQRSVRLPISCKQTCAKKYVTPNHILVGYKEQNSWDSHETLYFLFLCTYAIIISVLNGGEKGVKGWLNILPKKERKKEKVRIGTKLQVLRPYIAITGVMIWCLHHALLSILAVDLWETGNYDICPAIASFRFIPVVLFCLAYCLSTNQAGGALNLAKL